MQPGIILPFVKYAPTAANNPNIAAHPLDLSTLRVLIIY